MTLIAYGEIRFLSGEASLFARFAQADGQTLDLPLSEEQFSILITGLGVPSAAAAASPKRAPVVREEEDEGVADSRPFSVAFQSDEDDDEL